MMWIANIFSVHSRYFQSHVTNSRGCNPQLAILLNARTLHHSFWDQQLGKNFAGAENTLSLWIFLLLKSQLPFPNIFNILAFFFFNISFKFNPGDFSWSGLWTTLGVQYLLHSLWILFNSWYIAVEYVLARLVSFKQGQNKATWPSKCSKVLSNACCRSVQK